MSDSIHSARERLLTSALDYAEAGREVLPVVQTEGLRLLAVVQACVKWREERARLFELRADLRDTLRDEMLMEAAFDCMVRAIDAFMGGSDETGRSDR
jgi:hypothetical protein